jgi:hypothetical protein
MLHGVQNHLRALFPATLAWVAVLSIALVGGCAVADGAQAPDKINPDKMKTKNTQQAANEFLGEVEAAIGTLAIDREAFEVRANRCEGRQGETRDDLYYIWVGLRGTARGNDIAAQLETLHARWQEAGWSIDRFRKVDDGGVNLAATDPATGNHYSLDSGFEPAPAAYVVGFFNSPCYQSTEAKVDFGTIGAAR